MSRCFGFPPPGYSKIRSVNQNDNEALIFSIKLQRENEKAISNREREKKVKSSSDKEKKREKKERKKLKEKNKSHHASDPLVKGKQVVNLYESDKYTTLPENKCSSIKTKSELLEKSGITEEHGQPIELQKASCSSDSTGNSSKRQRTCTPPSTPANSIQSHGNGNILRIRLSSLKTEDEATTSGCNVPGTSVPLLKKEEHETKLFRNFHPCSSILREEPSVKHKDVKLTLDNKKVNLATSSTLNNKKVNVATSSRQDQKLVCLSQKIAPPLCAPAPPLVVAPPLRKAPGMVVAAPKPMLVTSPTAAAPPLRTAPSMVVAAPKSMLVTSPTAAAPPAPKVKLSSHEKKMLKKVAEYKELFESWVPPAIQHELVMDEDEDEDEDWLFGSKGYEKPAKRLKPNDTDINGEKSHVVPCASAALQPRASYLSDVGIYAMPFTIPF